MSLWHSFFTPPTTQRLLTYTCVWNAFARTWRREPGSRSCPQSQIAIKRQRVCVCVWRGWCGGVGGGRGVKMALKEPWAQLAGNISVRVAADDSQFSQPIIWALIYAQRVHSPPLTNQRPECLRLVTMANRSSVSKQSQRQHGGRRRLNIIVAPMGWIDKWRVGCTDRHMDRYIDIQTDGQTDR